MQVLRTLCILRPQQASLGLHAISSRDAGFLRPYTKSAREIRVDVPISSIASEYGQDRYNQKILLSDGRTLSWAETGSSTGSPIFLFHGSPGSRFEARMFDALGQKHKIRFVTPDRPGYGRSTFQPGRRLTDWPADVKSLARHLEIKRYGVLGISGGGPYALACANAMRSTELTSVGMLCSPAPLEAGRKELPLAGRVLLYAAANFPSLLNTFVTIVLRLARRYAGTASGRKKFDSIAKEMEAPPGSTGTASTPESDELVRARRERFTAMAFEPFASGPSGFVHEAYLFSQPYGFEPHDILYDGRIHIWHGTADANSPINMIRRLGERLPNCKMKEYEGETHFTMMKRAQEVVPQMLEKES